MTIEAIRFRAAEAGVILQVLERGEREPYYHHQERGQWRDAKVEDLLDVARFTTGYAALQRQVDELQQQMLYANNAMQVPP